MKSLDKYKGCPETSININKIKILFVLFVPKTLTFFASEIIIFVTKIRCLGYYEYTANI